MKFQIRRGVKFASLVTDNPIIEMHSLLKFNTATKKEIALSKIEAMTSSNNGENQGFKTQIKLPVIWLLSELGCAQA